MTFESLIIRPFAITSSVSFCFHHHTYPSHLVAELIHHTFSCLFLCLSLQNELSVCSALSTPVNSLKHKASVSLLKSLLRHSILSIPIVLSFIFLLQKAFLQRKSSGYSILDSLVQAQLLAQRRYSITSSFLKEKKDTPAQDKGKKKIKIAFLARLILEISAWFNNK